MTSAKKVVATQDKHSLASVPEISTELQEVSV